MKRRCIFCNTELGENGVERAKEHVVPAWLQEYLKLSEQEIYQAVVASGNAEPERERRHVSNSFQEGRVCKQCNGGWMNDLEGEFRPIFKDEVENRIPINMRSDADKLIVARWAAKTAFVLTWPSMLGKPVPAEQMAIMGQSPHLIPDGVCVYYARSEFSTSFSFLQMNRWLMIEGERLGSSSQRTDEAPAGSYKVGFSIGSMAFVVAYWKGEHTRQALMAGFHVPLFPNRPLWPAHTVVIYDEKVHAGVRALSSLVSGVGIILKSA